MRTELLSEYRKIVTTRTWWVLLLVMTAYMMVLGAVLAAAVTSGTDVTTGLGDGDAVDLTSPEAVRSSVYGVATAFGYVFPVIVGTLSMTGEVRYRTLTPTFLASPRRGRVLVAKMLAAVPVGALYGAVATLGTVGAGALVLALGGHPTLLGDGETWLLVARSTLALTLWAPLGVALGSVITHQTFSVVVILVWTQFLEVILRMGLSQAGQGGETVAAFLPGAAGEAITGGSLFSAAGLADPLSPAAGVAVLVGYTVLLAVLGRWTTLRRDVG